MVARLFEDRAPKTVAHLRALSDGTKAWRDPKTGQVVFRPLYDGNIFHRVVPGYYIQTGDPSGTGTGDANVPVPDEITPGARFDRPGLLGMASWGPGTSSTQFFITLSPQPDLNGRHTLFGELVEGLDVAKAIAAVPRDEKNGDRPLDPPVLKSLRVVAARPGMR
ncbi:MAG: peptidylprolyl isomerase [Elusimicrobia bacterium]|nr:peptidylprolyl isomerase [Elusimicrobiota bacterium]